MIVESSNPAHSLADSPRMREALERLDLLVVFDVAMTETARLADYVLPVAVAVREVGGELLLPRVPRATRSSCAGRSWIRRPDDLLPEPEIHCPARARRPARSTASTSTRLRAAAERARERVRGRAVRARRRAARAAAAAAGDRATRRSAATLPDGAASAAFLWLQAHGLAQMMPDSVRRAGFEGEGLRARRGAVRARSWRASRGSSSPWTTTTRRGSGSPTPTAESRSRSRSCVDELAAPRATSSESARRRLPVRAVGRRAARRTPRTRSIRDPAWRKSDRGRRAAHASRRRRAARHSPTAAARG